MDDGWPLPFAGSYCEWGQGKDLYWIPTSACLISPIFGVSCKPLSHDNLAVGALGHGKTAKEGAMIGTNRNWFFWQNTKIQGIFIMNAGSGILSLYSKTTYNYKG